MAAALRALTADRGATFRLSVRYLDASRSPVDLSAHTVALELLPRASTAVPTATFTGTGSAQGWAEVTVPDETTATWSGDYSYRLRIERAGEVDYLLVGRVTVRTPADG